MERHPKDEELESTGFATSLAAGVIFAAHPAAAAQRSPTTARIFALERLLIELDSGSETLTDLTALLDSFNDPADHVVLRAYDYPR